MPSKDKRKLAAIMFADVVGYSRMMASNEERTLALLKDFENICSPIISKHEGEIIKKVGDELFCEFSSAKQAVDSALAIQEAIQPYNDSRPKDFKLQVRIGIHVGDIILRDGDVYGDGVNVASRIQPFANPGGICVSNAVRDALSSHPNYDIQSEGKQELKNIIEQHTLYSIKTGFEDKTTIRKYRKSKKSIPVLIGILAVCIIGMLFFGDSLNIWKLDQGYQQRNIRETFLINMHSSSYLYNLIDSIKEKEEYEDFPEMQVFSDSLLNDTKNYVTAYLETKFFNLDVDLHYPSHQIQPILDKFPPYEMLEAGLVEWEELENNTLEVYEFYKNDGIYLDGIINIVFMHALFPEENQWGRTFIYNFYELDGGELNPWWSFSPEVDWGDDNSTVIKKETATYLYRKIHEFRFGGNYIGEVVEIVDLDLVKIYLSNTNIYKGVKVKLAKSYAAGKNGRKTWIDDLKYIDEFISHDEILINKYDEIMNGNKVLLDSLINNYSSIFAKDSILLAGGGSSYWNDGMNNYYGKILSITNNEAIVKVNKLEYPFGRMRIGDEVYIVDDY